VPEGLGERLELDAAPAGRAPDQVTEEGRVRAGAALVGRDPGEVE
jgi:hypothetical protein